MESDNSMPSPHDGIEAEKISEEETEPLLEEPKLYKVFLVNDDYTPMDFVVEVLEVFFLLDQTQAVKIMLEVHSTGRGLCGVYAHDVAETKVVQVNEYANQHQYPLLCSMEAAE